MGKNTRKFAKLSTHKFPDLVSKVQFQIKYIKNVQVLQIFENFYTLETLSKIIGVYLDEKKNSCFPEYFEYIFIQIYFLF